MRSAKVGRRGTTGGWSRGNGEKREAVGGGLGRTGSRPGSDAIKRSRRTSSRRRSEAAGI